MSALAALVLGALAVVYAVWPAIRSLDAETLPDDSDADAFAGINAAAATIRQWSEAAGELEPEVPEVVDPFEGEGRDI